MLAWAALHATTAAITAVVQCRNILNQSDENMIELNESKKIFQEST